MTPRLHDPEAEVSVAGCAIATRHGARLAAGRRLDPGDFHDPRLAALYVAALDLTDRPVAEEARVAAVARATGENVAFIASLLPQRLAMWDSSGAYHRRVIAAAKARRRAADLLDRLDRLGVEVDAVNLRRTA